MSSLAKRSMVLVGIAALGYLPTMAVGDTLYTVTALGSFFPQDLNDLGDVVGGRSFLHTGGELTDLGLTGSMVAINNNAQIAGQHAPYQAYVYENGTVTTLSEVDSIALALNEAGQVVGTENSRAALWQDGSTTALPFLTAPTFGDRSTAFAINESGQIAGWTISGVRANAVIWDEGAIIDLAMPDWDESQALDINDRGHVTGYWRRSPDQWRSFIWRNNEMTDLGNPWETGRIYAIGLNEAGQVVGDHQGANGVRRPFLWQDGVMFDLSDLADTSPDQVLNRALAINDVGQILAYGSLAGNPQSFLLTPIPEPTTLTILLPLLIVRSRRRGNGMS